MSKKTLMILFMIIIFPIATNLACLSSSKSIVAEKIEEMSSEDTETEEVVEEAATEEPQAATEEPEVVVVEPTAAQIQEMQQDISMEQSFWTQDQSTVFVAYLFRNPNTSFVIENINLDFYLLDAYGSELGHDWYDLSLIQPEQEFAVVFTYYLSSDQDVVNSISVNWETTMAPVSNALSQPIVANQINFWDNDGYPLVTGSIINANEFIYKYIQLNIVCFGPTGNIVGGSHEYIDFVPEYNEFGFSSYIQTFGDVATTKIFPVLTSSTEEIPFENQWTDIAIVDDHFYQGNYGWAYGGAVIYNNTSQSIENSIFQATFYDSNGRVISSAYDYIDFIFPGEQLGIVPWTYNIPDGSSISHYDIWILPGEPVTNYELSENPFQVTSLGLVGDYDDTVSVTFTNTYNKQASEVDVYVLLRNSNGEIIGGGYDWTSEATPAGGSTTIEVWVTYYSDEIIDEIEAWVVPNYWTEFD